LFDVVGTQFGVGDGSTTFNLPDLEDKFGRGAPSGSDSGATGGADSVTVTAAESGLPTHTHNYVESTAANGRAGGAAAANSQTVATGGVNGGAQPAAEDHENRPQFQQAVYVIRF